MSGHSSAERGPVRWSLTSNWLDNVVFRGEPEAAHSPERHGRPGRASYAPSPPTTSCAAFLKTSAPSRGHQGAPNPARDEAALRREIMRENNKHAARKSRQMKKEYVKHLETRLVALENQNKKLMEELSMIRDLVGPQQDELVPWQHGGATVQNNGLTLML